MASGNNTAASPSPLSCNDKFDELLPPAAEDSSTPDTPVSESLLLQGCNSETVTLPCTDSMATDAKLSAALPPLKTDSLAPETTVSVALPPASITLSSQPPTVEDSGTQASPPVHQASAPPHASSKDAPPSPFVPSLGSWAKPLIFKPPATPPDPSTPKGYDPLLVGNQLAALWPSLNDEILNKRPEGKRPTSSLQVPIQKLPPPELKADGSLRFPWAARLGPQSRNLFRAASPTYRLDGTPEVSIPSKVLKLGPENKDEYIIGKFHRCSLPPGGLIHAVANRIWGRSCKISCKKLSESSYMFHIPHQPTRQWVIQRGVWHIDDCLLFVLPWTPEGSFKIPEVSTLPVWVNLIDIPDCCYSRLGISHVASGLGEPILTHKPRLDPTSMGEAKVLVEMELDKDFPKLIVLDDKQGNLYLVKVEYTWIPSTCERCGSLGHKAKRCLMPSKPQETPGSSANPVGENVEIPIVDIDKILQEQNDGKVTGSFTKIAATVPHVDSPPELNINLQDVTHLHTDLVADSQVPNDSQLPPLECQVIQEVQEDFQLSNNNTSYSTPHVQEDYQIEQPALAKNFSPLVDVVSTPTSELIMETSPSNIINSEVQKTSTVDPFNTSGQVSGFESPSKFTFQGDEDIPPDEPMTSLGFTRGGRETRPPIRFQELGWKTVQSRGKRGRRGRGNTR